MYQPRVAVERVRYIGVSEVPTYYLLCPEDSTWSAAVLDEHDQVVGRFGPFRSRGRAIWEAEASIDKRTDSTPPDLG